MFYWKNIYAWRANILNYNTIYNQGLLTSLEIVVDGTSSPARYHPPPIKTTKPLFSLYAGSGAAKAHSKSLSRNCLCPKEATLCNVTSPLLQKPAPNLWLVWGYKDLTPLLQFKTITRDNSISRDSHGRAWSLTATILRFKLPPCSSCFPHSLKGAAPKIIPQ